MTISFFCPDLPDRTESDGEITLANANARALLKLLGEEPDDAGRLEANGLADVHRAILEARRLEAKRVPYRLDSYRDGNMIECGRTDDYLLRQLDALEQLLARAQATGSMVCWG